MWCHIGRKVLWVMHFSPWLLLRRWERLYFWLKISSCSLVVNILVSFQIKFWLIQFTRQALLEYSNTPPQVTLSPYVPLVAKNNNFLDDSDGSRFELEKEVEMKGQIVETMLLEEMCWNIQPGLLWQVILVRLLFVISHSFTMSHHRTWAKCSISFGPPLAPPDFSTQITGYVFEVIHLQIYLAGWVVSCLDLKYIM